MSELYQKGLQKEETLRVVQNLLKKPLSGIQAMVDAFSQLNASD